MVEQQSQSVLGEGAVSRADPLGVLDLGVGVLGRAVAHRGMLEVGVQLNPPGVQGPAGRASSPIGRWRRSAIRVSARARARSGSSSWKSSRRSCATVQASVTSPFGSAATRPTVRRDPADGPSAQDGARAALDHVEQPRRPPDRARRPARRPTAWPARSAPRGTRPPRVARSTSSSRTARADSTRSASTSTAPPGRPASGRSRTHVGRRSFPRATAPQPGPSTGRGYLHQQLQLAVDLRQAEAWRTRPSEQPRHRHRRSTVLPHLGSLHDREHMVVIIDREGPGHSRRSLAPGMSPRHPNPLPGVSTKSRTAPSPAKQPLANPSANRTTSAGKPRSAAVVIRQ